MLNVFSTETRLIPLQASEAAILPEGVAWIDLLRPTQDEEKFIARSLGIEIPTREEMQEIEPSSRLYIENGAMYLTANILVNADTDEPGSTAVTFILSGQRLITIRYAEPRPFVTFAAHITRQPGLCVSGPVALINLLDAIVDRIADILEKVGADVDGLSRHVFRRDSKRGTRRRSEVEFEAVLRRIAHNQDLTAKARDSLVSLGRLLSFLALPGEAKQAKDLRMRAKSLSRDVMSLTDHTGFVAGNINFLLETNMGMINIEQNAIIKIFSVAAVVFLPPTLVASIYGMNFEFMPELKWMLGYPLAIGLMIVSAVLPYLWFKHRGWL
ncbi:Magnesium transporter CorA family protein [Rhodovastum atsumiense]|uniref:Magnesium transport protein CorA n=1 Tax=Rhodovastum atsumiense TaxID=504468 RepID=A0A5M6IMN3_9PROT|nr:magnesium transporter CorA family protein [Rhodovastum atsumiense]KAA5609217.1 magnesium transporter CorA family protein [Rhodovastum atsumiense]CAH2603948.1 Magnesium transporter CorA family protein [Rhodovastum atsumiense]